MYSPLSKILQDYKEGKVEHWEAHEKILRLFNVVGRSEQLSCDCNVKLAETTLQVYCPKCYKTHKMK